MSIETPHVAQPDLPLDVFRISAMLIHFAARFDAEGQAEFFEALSSSVSLLRDVSKDTADDQKRAAREKMGTVQDQEDPCVCSR